jgi:hypothetical protein
MSNISSLVHAATMTVSGFSLFRSKSLATVEKDQSNTLHKKVIQQSESFHDTNVLMSKQTYLIQSSTSLEQHIQQLNLDLFNNAREAERDMFDQVFIC